MKYDPDTRTATMSNGRKYTPAIFRTPERDHMSEPCTKDPFCGRPHGHSGPCYWEKD